MTAIETQVLVVGAGPTGLTLACCLARHGIRVRIIEQASAHSTVARATAYQPRTLEVFDDLGVIEPALAGVWTDMPMRSYVDGRLVFDASTIAAKLPRVAEKPYPTMARPLPTWRVEEILRERLGELGVRVELGCRLGDLDAGDPSAVIATVDGAGGTETIRTSYVVGCDGAHSTVRRALDIGFEPMAEHDFVSYLAELDVVGLEPTYARLWLSRAGTVFLSPVPLSRTWQFQAQVARDDAGDVQNLDATVARRVFEERSGLRGIEFREPTWTSVYVVRERLADRYRVGNVFIAGDAAHVHSPMGGQGANTGIQDAYNLGWKLAHVLDGSASPRLLDSYEAERRPVARRVLRGSGTATDMVFSRGLLGRLARWALFGVLGKKMITSADQLGIAYRGSPLSFAPKRRITPGISAGDRAPDARVIRRGDGARMRLFDVFRGPHFTLLLFGAGLGELGRAVAESYGDRVHTVVVKGVDDAVSGWSGTTLIDPHGTAARAYGATRGGLAALVRPDGYLSYLRTPDDGKGLFGHLRTLLDEPAGTGRASAGTR